MKKELNVMRHGARLDCFGVESCANNAFSCVMNKVEKVPPTVAIAAAAAAVAAVAAAVAADVSAAVADDDVVVSLAAASPVAS